MRIVFDIGGTTFRYAKYVDGVLVAAAKEPTPNFLQGHDPKTIHQRLLKLIAETIGADQSRITQIGLCYAGPVSSDGKVLGSPTIQGAALERPFDLKHAVQTLVGIPDVWVINDLSAAAYRYLDDYRSFELITVSTSVGNKIVIDGRLQLGPEGLEGELGHLLACLPTRYAEAVAIDCSCGTGLNHIGAIASGRGIVEVAKQLSLGALSSSYATSLLRSSAGPDSNDPDSDDPDSEQLTAADISAACEQGDVFAQCVIDICTYPLAHAICLTLTSLYLEKVILMGGVILNSQPYFDSLLRNILRIGVYNYSPEHLRQKIIKGAADDDSGLIGMCHYLDAQR